jgi:cob(II)yrinic acid a,c-diamide reductase
LDLTRAHIEPGVCVLHRQNDTTNVAAADYRDAMSRYAGHVQIVTTRFGQTLRGITATAACSVSDAPPTVLVCINRINERNEPFFRSGRFALNTLSADQQAVADAFSGLTGIEDSDRFSTATWEELATGAPCLVGAAAVFDCHVLELKPMSTHMVVFGQVVGLSRGASRSALLYHDRRYSRIAGDDGGQNL